MTHTPLLAGLALLALLGGAMDVARRPDGNPVVGTVTIGPDPGTLVVDTRTNRVFVGDALRGTFSMLDAASGRLLRTTSLPVAVYPTAPSSTSRPGACSSSTAPA